MPETALASEQLLLNPGAQLRVVEAPDGDPPGAPEPARRPQPRLEIPGYDLGAAVALERELGIGHVLAQILVRRGLRDPVVAREFLEARQRHPPSAFSGIERAVEVIARHIRARTRITVHGDYDVDGVAATAVLVRALRALGADVV